MEAVTDEEVLLPRAEELARRADYAAARSTTLRRACARSTSAARPADRPGPDERRVRPRVRRRDAKPALRDIVREVDRVQFGGRVPDGGAASRARRSARWRSSGPFRVMLARLWRSERSAAAAAARRARAQRPADDPAGGELLRELLSAGRRCRDARARPRVARRSEGRRARTRGGHRPRTTVLDDETREHLDEWVDAGGVLVLAGNPSEWPKAFGAPSGCRCARGAHGDGAPAACAERRPTTTTTTRRAGDDHERVSGLPGPCGGLEHASVAEDDVD